MSSARAQFFFLHKFLIFKMLETEYILEIARLTNTLHSVLASLLQKKIRKSQFQFWENLRKLRQKKVAFIYKKHVVQIITLSLMLHQKLPLLITTGINAKYITAVEALTENNLRPVSEPFC